MVMGTRFLVDEDARLPVSGWWRCTHIHSTYNDFFDKLPSMTTTMYSVAQFAHEEFVDWLNMFVVFCFRASRSVAPHRAYMLTNIGVFGIRLKKFASSRKLTAKYTILGILYYLCSNEQNLNANKMYQVITWIIPLLKVFYDNFQFVVASKSTETVILYKIRKR